MIEFSAEDLLMIPEMNTGFGKKGAALHRMGRYEEAESAYLHGLRIDPNNQELRCGLCAVQVAKRLRVEKQCRETDGDSLSPRSSSSKSYERRRQDSDDDWQRFLHERLGVDQFGIQASLLECFRNYLQSGVAVKRHPWKKHSSISLIQKRFISKQLLWLTQDQTAICIGKKLHPDVEVDKNAQDVAGDSGEGYFVIPINMIRGILKGRKTHALRRSGTKKNENCYISILTRIRHGKAEDRVSVDIQVPQAQREFIFSRLTLLVINLQKNRTWFDTHFSDKQPKQYRQPQPLAQANNKTPTPSSAA